LWRNVCDGLAEYLGGVGSVFVPEDLAQQGPWLVSSASLEPLISAIFRDNWHLRNPRRRTIPVIKQRGYGSDLDLPDTVVKRDPFYNELIAQQKLGSFVGIGLDVGKQTWIASVELAANTAPLGDEMFARTDRVRQSLLAAMRTSEALGAHRFESWRDLLAETGRAIFVIDRNGRVLDRNAASEPFMVDGLLLKKGLLAASDPARDPAFQNLLGVARLSAPGAALPPPVLWRSPQNQLLVADAMPINQKLLAFHDPAAALIVVRTVQQRALGLVDLVKERASLTDAEARLAVALFEGKSLAEYAADVGNTVGTVRQQLKAVFRKTQTGRQAELVTWIRKTRPETGE